jgi:hypothetical protein
MLVAGVGSSVAFDMGLAAAAAADGDKAAIRFGADIEPLVLLMQETPADKLLPQLVERFKGGTNLKTLITAGALANARTFGGEDYIGYHSFMALLPAYQMAQEMPKEQQLLPVLKVLHRNTSRMQAQGGCEHEVLKPVTATKLPGDRAASDVLQDLTRTIDREGAEGAFAAMTEKSVADAYMALQQEIQDEVDVHRVVLSWRAWAMLDLTGQQYAHTLLRQSVRYCLQSEKYHKDRNHPNSAIRTQLPKLFDQYKLLSKSLGTRQADDAWIEEFSRTVHQGSPAKAADAAAAALADGISPESIGEGLSIAANALVLHDPGRRDARPDKPVGSVHGDSVGVHASDAANAWRNIARVSNQRNTAASLIVGAFHTAGQTGGSNKQAYPLPEHLSEVTTLEPAKLLTELDAAIRAQDQFSSCAIATKYGQAGGEVRPIMDMLLGFATSEDGALHAEKYYRTVSEEFTTVRPAFRWRQVAALARVTASEYGKPAPGYALAKELLKA